MLKRWAQVLTDGKNIDIMLMHIMHDLDDLIPGLAKAQHETRLGWSGRIHLLGPLQYLQRTFVHGLWTDLLVESWHRLDVVVEDIGFRIDHHTQGIIDAFKVWCQDFHPAVRIQATDPANSSGKDGGSAILEFVTVH